MNLINKEKIIIYKKWTLARAKEHESWSALIMIFGQILGVWKPHLWVLFTSCSVGVANVIKLITKGAHSTAVEVLNAAADALDNVRKD